MTAWAAAASSVWRMSAASKPSVFRPSSRSSGAPSEASRSKAKKCSRRSATAAGSLARTVPAAALRGLISGLSGCASLYFVNVERSITASPRTSTRPPDVHALGHAVGQGADEHGDVVAGRPVPARHRPREPPVLVDERQRQPVQLGHHDHGLAGEAGEEGLDLLGLGRLLQREHRPRVPDRRVQHRRRPDLLERIRVRRELGMLGDQRRAARPRSRRTPRRPPTACRGSTSRAARRSDRRVPGSARGCSSPAP